MKCKRFDFLELVIVNGNSRCTEGATAISISILLALPDTPLSPRVAGASAPAAGACSAVAPAFFSAPCSVSPSGAVGLRRSFVSISENIVEPVRSDKSLSWLFQTVFLRVHKKTTP